MTPPSTAAVEFLQDHAAFTRRGHAGAVQADTDGYVAAAFTHRTSRARDPQLHTHVLVSAKVRASTDGAWLALDGRELFEVQKAGGLVYKAGLRAEMRARLGSPGAPSMPMEGPRSWVCRLVWSSTSRSDGRRSRPGPAS